MVKNAIRMAVVGVVGGCVSAASGQYSLTGTTYSQNFDTLGTSNVGATGGNLSAHNSALNGWYFHESGVNANSIMTAGTGTSNAGDTYNFGASGGADRTLGGLYSTNLNPTFGFYFYNNSGSAIASLTISYTGETWRVGSANRSDRLDFQYSTDATSLSTGTWQDVDALDYANPGQSTGNGSVQHSASISASLLLGTPLANGSSLFIRWTDFNASSSDDGMGVDDFSFTAVAPLTGFTWTGTGGGETWADGQPGHFGANYSNGTLPVEFKGVAETVTLSGSVESGPLTFTTNDYTLTGGVSLKIGGTGVISVASGITSVNSKLTGSGGLLKTGSGTLVLGNASNENTGGWTVSGGTLQVSADGHLGSSANDVALSSGTLRSTASFIAGSGRDFTGSGTIALPSGVNLTSTGSFNTTALTLSEGGTLTLNGTTRNVGTLTFAGANTLAGSGTISSTSGNVTVNDGVGTATVSADLDVGAVGSGSRFVDVGSGSKLILAGNLIGTGSGSNRLVKSGAGELELQGANPGFFRLSIGVAGATPTNGGTVTIGTNTSLGTEQTYFNYGTLQASVSMTGANAIPNSISVGGRQGSAASFGGANPIEVTGNIVLFAASSTSGNIVIGIETPTTLSGVIEDTTSSSIAALEFTGSSTLTIAGGSPNLLTKPVVINGPTVKANKTTSFAGAVTVQSGTLGGSGSITGAVTVNSGGTLAPGTSIESLDVGSLALDAGSTFEVEVDVDTAASNTPGVHNDVVNVASTGSVAIGGTLRVVLLNVGLDGIPGTSGLTYTIINNQSASAVTGVFDSVVFVNAPGPVVYSWTKSGGDGNDVELHISSIPEPASLSLLLVGALGLRRRRPAR